MAVLTPQQRTVLEKAVKEARKASEIGAVNALQAMAVHHPEPYAHMSPEQRSLRNALRSKARLLGDALLPSGEQQMSSLAYELAYETWHKMLFATFLEANSLLVHHSGIAVTFADCEELAVDEGYTDKWDAAAAYASKMLPAIFRVDDPLMQVQYATNDKIKLEVIIGGLEKDIFTADDALGWVYQFWQSQAKEDINKSGDKIDGAKLPAVTQLFTEPYMVHFLIDNTLGAWWVSRNPGVSPPVKFEYLRKLEDGTPAAGNFEGWPNTTAEVTSLDPCMGSGHFVASLFPVFAALRMHEEGLSKEEATDKVISENLHGLEIDPRCTQIAAFNLALTAWKFCGHYRELPEMNLACSGIAPKGNVEDWVKLVGKGARFEDKERMENGMRALYDHFQLAPELGSLLDPTTIKGDQLYTASFEELEPVLEKALESEDDSEQVERGVIAHGIAKCAAILNRRYTLIITNPPYLGNGKMSSKLKNFCDQHFSSSKHDLATVFVERLWILLINNGVNAFVLPQNWQYSNRFLKFREKTIKTGQWLFSVNLGAGAFSQISGEIVQGLLWASSLSIVNSKFFIIDAAKRKSIYDKQRTLIKGDLISTTQHDQQLNPNKAIGKFDIKPGSENLGAYFTSLAGSATGDKNRFVLNFTEVLATMITRKLFWLYHDQPKTGNFFSGYTSVIRWEDEQGEISDVANFYKNENNIIQNWRRGKPYWGGQGLAIGLMGSNPMSRYMGNIYDCGVCVLHPKNPQDNDALIVFAESGRLRGELRQIHKGLSVSSPNTFLTVPFDLEHWQKIADEKYPHGLPKPYSDDPTQWLFHGHPVKADYPLQVATARLLGYRWPAESDEEMELADEARTLTEEVKAFDSLTDDDGIFCIPSVNAEQAGADRLRAFLQTVFGAEYNTRTVTELLAKEGVKASNLEDWLRNEFFLQHCKVFGNRPFLWQIWDGRKDGFSVIVNYHKLNKENLSKLIYTYLGDWIRMCEAKRNAGESGADGLLDAAKKLQEKLILILNGEAPYDIFVRWKPLSEQPIGWEPDLNDGVRLNIRPFVEAGILRNKFNIKWGVDRGKNPPNSHWGEIRDNDRHLSLEEKRTAREN